MFVFRSISHLFFAKAESQDAKLYQTHTRSMLCVHMKLNDDGFWLYRHPLMAGGSSGADPTLQLGNRSHGPWVGCRAGEQSSQTLWLPNQGKYESPRRAPRVQRVPPKTLFFLGGSASSGCRVTQTAPQSTIPPLTFRSQCTVLLQRK